MTISTAAAAAAAATPEGPALPAGSAVVPPQPASDRLPPRQLLSYAVAGVPYNLGTDGVKTLANPIYNIILGVNPAWIGILLMVIRICDALMDPVVGTWSDNTRSRWGRRRPFIAMGVILCALTFPMIWFVPADSTPTFAIGYLTVTALLFYASFSIFCVPFVSLAMELSPGYSERTRITGIRTMFSGLAGLIAAWAFRVAQMDVFPDTLTGIRVVGVGIGVTILCLGLPAALFTRERGAARVAAQPKLPLLASFRATFGNKPFRIILGMVLFLMLGNYTANSLQLYINTYYLFDGDFKQGAMLVGIVTTATTVVNFAMVPVVIWIAGKWGKTRTLALCLGMGSFAGALRLVTIDPAHPYWQLVEPIFMTPANVGFWVIVNSMKADCCDHDEMHSRVRREGAYAAVFSWLTKFSTALTYMLGGVLLVVIGFDQALGGAQSADTLLKMRWAYIVTPVLAFGSGLILLRHYTLSAQRMADIRVELELRRGAV